MGNAVTNDTYTFTPQSHSIFNKENTDPNIKIQTVIPTLTKVTKLRGHKGGTKK